MGCCGRETLTCRLAQQEPRPKKSTVVSRTFMLIVLSIMSLLTLKFCLKMDFNDIDDKMSMASAIASQAKSRRQKTTICNKCGKEFNVKKIAKH